MTPARVALAGALLLALAGCADRYPAPDWALSGQWVPLEGPPPADNALPLRARFGATR